MSTELPAQPSSPAGVAHFPATGILPCLSARCPHICRSRAPMVRANAPILGLPGLPVSGNPQPISGILRVAVRDSLSPKKPNNPYNRVL
jgi:hypothetical protein